MRKILAGVLSLVATAVFAQGASTPREIVDLRLLPPTFRAPPALDLRTQLPTLTKLARERHPEVFEKVVAGTYLVLLLIDPEGRVQQSRATEVQPGAIDGVMIEQLAPLAGSSVVTFNFLRDRPLPDGSSNSNNVAVIAATVPAGYDASRAVSRVHDAVRRSHADLLLSMDGPVLNQLTVLMNEAGSIQRHSVAQLRSEDLRRAPMEDEQFAERMAARIANLFSMDAARLGVVGFTHVMDTAALAPSQPGQAVIPRWVLVQYAWPRKPGETGPSAPMATTTQQSVRTFDEQAALRLAEHYFPEAFTGTAAEAGTPTIALSPQGQVIAAGRVQYGSGANHEKLISEQLVPGIRSGAFVSPQLTNAAGKSVVVSFVWGEVAGSAR